MEVELRQDNPYASGTISDFDNGESLLYREPIKVIPTDKDKVHRVIDGDTLSYISGLYYGSSRWLWALMDVNGIVDPFTLITGTELIIPDLNKIKVSI